MRLFISTLVAIAFAQSAMAGSLSPSGKYSPHSGKVTRGSCSSVLVGGCSYCIGGVLYQM